jgi:DNA-binding response OmpR family regulator
MKTILLIEDNSEFLQNLTEYLQLEGYRILACSNGEKGIILARRFIPDLIICDVLMPDLNGTEVLHLLLIEPRTSKIPFIFSTSISDNVDGPDALKLGADDYITKPYELDTLLQKAKAWIISGSRR